MPFQALTGAPMLRDGVTLNIMAYPQSSGIMPEPLAVGGAPVTLRFGHCCPLVKQGRIAALEADPDRAILILDDATWALEATPTRISIPGIMSRDWIVRAAASGARGRSFA